MLYTMEVEKRLHLQIAFTVTHVLCDQKLAAAAAAAERLQRVREKFI